MDIFAGAILPEDAGIDTMMRIAWVGTPQFKDARKTANAWLAEAPADMAIIRDLDPSSDIIVFHNPERMSRTQARLLLRRRFGKKFVLCIHDFLDFMDLWVGKRATPICNSVRLLLFWSPEHEEIFRRAHPNIATPGTWVPIIAEAPEQDNIDLLAYETALSESAERFWEIIRGLAC